MYMTEWVPTTGDVYKLMDEPSNIKDSNAAAIVRGKSGEKETHRADDVHPNNVTENLSEEVATVSRFLANISLKVTASLVVGYKRS